MAKSRSIRRNSSFSSIREAGSCNVQPDANEDEQIRKEVINIDALRIISRIVLAIQRRIDAANSTGTSTESCGAGSSGSSEITGPNSDKDINQREAADR